MAGRTHGWMVELVDGSTRFFPGPNGRLEGNAWATGIHAGQFAAIQMRGCGAARYQIVGYSGSEVVQYNSSGELTIVGRGKQTVLGTIRRSSRVQ